MFGTSSSEFAGFRLLAFTALICWVGLMLANHFSKSPYDSYEKDAMLLDSLLLVMDKNQLKVGTSENRIVYEKFDPNTVSEEKLIDLGLTTPLARRLINYRATGAHFSNPNDLLKIYGFPEPLFTQLEPYIIIKPSSKLKKAILPVKSASVENKIKKVEDPLPAFDLNNADTSILKTINGIGSKLSSRIVKYRTSLGGFISKNQLYEIYRLDSGVVEKISKTSIIAKDFQPTKININKATKEQLATHPYINWTQAKLIIAYRNQHGAFLIPNDLVKVYSIDKNWVKKNAPYLTF